MRYMTSSTVVNFYWQIQKHIPQLKAEIELAIVWKLTHTSKQPAIKSLPYKPRLLFENSSQDGEEDNHKSLQVEQ